MNCSTLWVILGSVAAGNFSWLWKQNVTLSAGVKFTQQVSSHPDLDWKVSTSFPAFCSK